MLIVISNPTFLKDEAAIINQLFDAGMELFHLRKPSSTTAEIQRLLKEVHPEYYPLIALHQDHALADIFKITRLHFTGEKRKKTGEEELMAYKKRGCCLSTSIHTVKEYQNISVQFDYTFFGPVFNSLSKQEYKAAVSDDFVFPIEESRPKAIAIGGLEAKNVRQAIQMNFNGIAVLGTIWQKPDKSIEQFKTLKKTWEQAGR